MSDEMMSTHDASALLAEMERLNRGDWTAAKLARSVLRLHAEVEAHAEELAAERLRRAEACDENRELRAAKATLRRRLRGVLWQARAWKRTAVAYGWRRGDKAAPGALCACDEWRGPAHMAGCPFARDGGAP